MLVAVGIGVFVGGTGVLVGAGVFVGVGVGVYWYAGRPATPAFTPPAAEPAGSGVSGIVATDNDPFDTTITYTKDGFLLPI